MFCSFRDRAKRSFGAFTTLPARFLLVIGVASLAALGAAVVTSLMTTRPALAAPKESPALLSIATLTKSPTVGQRH